ETPVTKIRFPRRFTPDKTSSVVEVAPNWSFPVLAISRPPFRFRRAPLLLTERRYFGKTESVSECLDNRSLSPVTSFMPTKRSKAVLRKPRTDAQRNRNRILEVAKEAFSRSGATASLDDIAKQAGVGAGTLYRHFPSRDALLEAVYRNEVE